MSNPEKSQFLLLFRNAADEPDRSPQEMELIFGKWINWMKSIKSSGVYVGGHPLGDEGKVLRGPKGATLIDGPFAEAKETVGGYIIVTADSLEGAVEIAKDCPGYEYGTIVEVRPIEHLPSL